MKKRKTGDDAFIIEFRTLGNSVKVSAIDPVTLIEASIVGPASENKEVLERAAVRKLLYVIKKKKKGDNTG